MTVGSAALHKANRMLLMISRYNGAIINEKEDARHSPVIAVSAAALKSDVEKGLKAGFLDYLTKPIVVNELIEAVNRGLAVNKRTGSQRSSSVV